MKKKYDLVFSMGYACSCSQMIRAAGLQFASFPLDWVAPLNDRSMARLLDALCSDFANWFDKKDLVLLPQTSVAEWEAVAADVYHNVRTDFFFTHDFVRGADFDKAYEEVAEKYRRRIDRFLGLLKSAKSVLLVRIDSPAVKSVTTAEDCKVARARLMSKYPGVAFDFIYLTIDRTRSFARRLEETVSEGVLHVAFDYVDRRPDVPCYLTKVTETGAALAAHAKVRDYRTPEERREYVRRRHQSRWAKLGATTFWGYQLARLRRAFSK